MKRALPLALSALALCALELGALAVVAPASAQFVPRNCGMSAGVETYGTIDVGTAIVLGRHSPWAGDANWDPAMERYVGATAIVTQLAGVDSAGCPGVRVGIDGAQFFWRIRDAQLAGYGAPQPQPVRPPPPRPPIGFGGGDSIPRHCGMAAGRESYGALRAGTAVVLGRHAIWGGDANWSAGMDRFVGSIATITSFDGIDAQGCPGVRVSVDGGQWFWRIRDMQLAGGQGYPPPPPMPPPPPPIAIPSWCGMTAGGETYGPITIGSWVILGAHSPWNGETNWAPEMMRWVGQRAQVTRLGGLDTVGCPGVYVAADGGQYFWRIRDLRSM